MNALRLFVVVLLSVFACTAAAERLVFVSIAGESRIATFALDEQSGVLSEQNDVQVSGQPGALCLHPNQKFLFASIKSTGNLASFRIDDDGQLALVSNVAAGADPSFLATDSSGRFLVSAYYAAGKVCVHAIDSGGKLNEQPLQTVVTDAKAHGVVFDSSNQFVFVPHTGPNVIYQFRFDSSSGKLSANTPAKVMRPEMTGPRHLWFRPDGNFAYGSDEQGSSITVYSFDAADGTLQAVQTLSTLPRDVAHAGANSTSDIEVHPSGKFVYVANRGHDSIARFGIDTDSGLVTHLGNTATEKTTRSFNIDPSGRYMIAAGQNSGKLATFKIGPDGSLERIATTDVGPRPWWVLIFNR